MQALLKISFYITLFLLLFQLVGKGYTGYAGIVPGKAETVLQHMDFQHMDDASVTPGVIHLAYNLQAPDAITIPVVSFQFGFIEAFCLFLLTWLCCCNENEACRNTPRFTCSYFEKLFSSLILINAP